MCEVGTEVVGLGVGWVDGRVVNSCGGVVVDEDRGLDALTSLSGIPGTMDMAGYSERVRRNTTATDGRDAQRSTASATSTSTHDCGNNRARRR